MPPPPQNPALPDELIEDIFIRLPADEPEFLVRASLANKHWLGLLTGPRFRGRYHDFHGSPPMLGFLYSWPPDYTPKKKNNIPHFVPTTKFRARIPDDQEDAVSKYSTWDCRHGRVLFCDMDMVPMQLTVWNPMTGCRRWIRAPVDYHSQRAAVACAVSGCDHRACHEGPFWAVFVSLGYGDGGCVAYAHVSLPELGEWSKDCSTLDLEADDASIVDKPSVFIEDAFYFMLTYDYDEDDDDDDDGNDDDDVDEIVILKYDLASNCLSLIVVPPVEAGLACDAILMAMEDGSLGFAYVDRLILNLWSRQMGFSGAAAWTQRRIIDLKELLSIQNPKKTIRLIGSVERHDIIFVTMDVGIYEINIKSLQWKKLWKRENYRALFPYMSFYNPQG
ncbi:hypothetical protein ACQ4PT_002596 [Festuca glaucescens]